MFAPDACANIIPPPPPPPPEIVIEPVNAVILVVLAELKVIDPRDADIDTFELVAVIVAPLADVITKGAVPVFVSVVGVIATELAEVCTIKPPSARDDFVVVTLVSATSMLVADIVDLDVDGVFVSVIFPDVPVMFCVPRLRTADRGLERFTIGIVEVPVTLIFVPADTVVTPLPPPPAITDAHVAVDEVPPFGV